MAAMFRDSTVVAILLYRNTATHDNHDNRNTASHDNHKEINSWVSFSFYGYGAQLGGFRPPELRYKATKFAFKRTWAKIFGRDLFKAIAWEA